MSKKKMFIAIALAFIIGILAGGLWFGGLMGSVGSSLKKLLTIIPPRLWVGFVFKLLVLTGLMGWVTKLVNARKERFLAGEVEYRFDGGYSLVVGYDFQARPLIKRLLSGSAEERVLLITDRDVRAIRAEMTTELTRKESSRLMYMRRDLALESTYSGQRIRGARAVYILGDEGVSGRDGIVLRASEMIAAKAMSETKLETDVPVKAYLQFEDPGIYSQMRSQELSMDCKGVDGETIFDLEVFNYYDSWVWKCWSEKDSADGEPYLPLRFKPDAERVELFVIGSGKAMKFVVDSAITLLNYGDDERKCRMSVVTDRASEVLPADDVIVSLPELELVDYPMRDFTRMVSGKMIEAASDEKCAVTVVIVEDAPEKAIRTYMALPFSLRSLEISALLWMGAPRRNLPEKSLIKVVGDKTNLRYFGMFDYLPWIEGSRAAVGADVNYYYSVHKELPKGVDTSLAGMAQRLWDEASAIREWNGSKRWKKWSSINSSGSYKEKAALIAGRELTPDLQLRLLKAEHNRWWAERLLADWRVGERDDVRRIHPNLVPFEQLDDFTKDIDKICIAAMVRQGFIAST